MTPEFYDVFVLYCKCAIYGGITIAVLSVIGLFISVIVGASFKRNQGVDK